ncbi:hypothetical protein EYF80_005703 [Liparis tanakae]|uniref:Uncharacterized protein n=1 Tax=Liparis tanakae TaxID=230148 RepID=A0A4Z2J246_9TELE|nr:hypothetical protein EYF80_005703 [Liparis tanakae]
MYLLQGQRLDWGEGGALAYEDVAEVWLVGEHSASTGPRSFIRPVDRGRREGSNGEERRGPEVERGESVPQRAVRLCTYELTCKTVTSDSTPII